MNYKELMSQDLLLIDEALERYLEVKDPMVPHLFGAMKYTTMAGGKRIRAFLVTMFARLTGGEVESALPFACALEMIHAYSLIHDDLPCMDDDDLRRGKPSNHIVFGEANALLAGDALLTYAFQICSENAKVSPKLAVKAISVLSECAGPCGMVGGQVLDLEGEKRKLDKNELSHVHKLKTGALIKAAASLGCCTSEKGLVFIDSAAKYGENLGLSFQLIDDILDVTGDEATLGKPIGSDGEQNKTTYLDYMSISDAKAYAERLTKEGCDALGEGEYADMLRQLAIDLLERKK